MCYSCLTQKGMTEQVKEKDEDNCAVDMRPNIADIDAKV